MTQAINEVQRDFARDVAAHASEFAAMVHKLEGKILAMVNDDELRANFELASQSLLPAADRLEELGRYV